MTEFDSRLFQLLRSLGGRIDRLGSVCSFQPKIHDCYETGEWRSGEGSVLNPQNSAAMAEADSCYQGRSVCIRAPKTPLHAESWLTNEDQYKYRTYKSMSGGLCLIARRQERLSWLLLHTAEQN